MSPPPPAADLLVTFAFPDEARPFLRLLDQRPGIQTLVTGIGSAKAATAISMALAKSQPRCVLTCGFAGALNPSLRLGDLLLDTSAAPTLASTLRQLPNIHTARFTTSHRVAITTSDKHQLHLESGADAVEMESAAIQQACLSQNIPCAILRVVSDDAHNDLPFDFNQFLDADGDLSLRRILAALAAKPGNIPNLLRFQRQTRFAAQRLAATLLQAVNALQNAHPLTSPPLPKSQEDESP